MTTTLELITSKQVTIGADGTGAITFGPERGSESWSVERVSVQCTSALSSTARIYRNVISDLTMLFDTRTGNADVASGDPPMLIPRSGHFIVEWRNATPGAIATAVVEGKLTR